MVYRENGYRCKEVEPGQLESGGAFLDAVFDDGYGYGGVDRSGVGGPVEERVARGTIEPCGFGACLFVTEMVRKREGLE